MDIQKINVPNGGEESTASSVNGLGELVNLSRITWEAGLGRHNREVQRVHRLDSVVASTALYTTESNSID
jgi:hypothetical protein